MSVNREFPTVSPEDALKLNAIVEVPKVGPLDDCEREIVTVVTNGDATPSYTPYWDLATIFLPYEGRG